MTLTDEQYGRALDYWLTLTDAAQDDMRHGAMIAVPVKQTYRYEDFHSVAYTPIQHAETTVYDVLAWSARRQGKVMAECKRLTLLNRELSILLRRAIDCIDRMKPFVRHGRRVRGGAAGNATRLLRDMRETCWDFAATWVRVHAPDGSTRG